MNEDQGRWDASAGERRWFPFALVAGSRGSLGCLLYTKFQPADSEMTGSDASWMVPVSGVEGRRFRSSALWSPWRSIDDARVRENKCQNN